MQGNYFRLFADCIPVKGAKRGTLCDLTRGRIKVIPLVLCDLLELLKTQPITQVEEVYHGGPSEGLQKYIQQLYNEEWGFFSNEAPTRFPDMDLTWHSPATITNAIIDRKDGSLEGVREFVQSLDRLQCQAVQIRFFSATDIAHLNTLLSLFSSTTVISIELMVKNASTINEDSIEALLQSNPLIRYVFLYNCDQKKIRQMALPGGILELTTEKEITVLQCGKVDKRYFAPNIPHFTEAQKHNSCLNRKISIDVNGNIKNCPSMKDSFGHVTQVNIDKVLEDEQFRKFWFLNKDSIIECKDCEFRYVCTDCRAFIKDSSDIYSKPAKCNYDPYTATWS